MLLRHDNYRAVQPDEDHYVLGPGVNNSYLPWGIMTNWGLHVYWSICMTDKRQEPRSIHYLLMRCCP